MSGGQQAAVATRVHELPDFARRGTNDDAGVVPVGAAFAQREQQRTVGERLAAVRHLPGLEFDQLLGPTALLADAPNPIRSLAIVDVAVRFPAQPPWVARGGEQQRRATGGRHPAQFVVGPEHDLRAVGREDRIPSAVVPGGAAHGVSLETVEGASPDLITGAEGQRAAVARNRHGCAPGAAEGETLGQRHLEPPDGPWLRRRRRREPQAGRHADDRGAEEHRGDATRAQARRRGRCRGR